MNTWMKLPGLYHRSELEQVIEVDGQHEYLFRSAGQDGSGQELVAVYCRAHRFGPDAALLDVPRAPVSAPRPDLHRGTS